MCTTVVIFYKKCIMSIVPWEAVMDVQCDSGSFLYEKIKQMIFKLRKKKRIDIIDTIVMDWTISERRYLKNG